MRSRSARTVRSAVFRRCDLSWEKAISMGVDQRRRDPPMCAGTGVTKPLTWL
jgi:hypothetical protein